MYIEPFQKVIVQYLNKNLNLSLEVSSDIFSNVVVFIFTIISGVIGRYINRDTTVMGEHSTPIENEFPEKNYKVELKEFINNLKNELDRLDSETNWSQFWFTPLEASVEVHYGKSKMKKKIKELINAIKTDRKSKTFLVIGDPGGGKSVALRRLSRELLNEVEKTGKIPVYINLKEWKASREWSEKEPPKSEELLAFIITNLKERLNNVFIEKFIDKYF